MSRRTSAILSWLSSFLIAYLLGSKIGGRQTGVRAGFVAATVAAAVSWLAYGIAETIEFSQATEPRRVSESGQATNPTQEPSSGGD